MNANSIIGILGPTASGKTKYAVKLALELNAEIISMDSRQVYRELNIGAGKDLEEYHGVPYHLINIVDLSTQYHIHQFKKDFNKAYHDIVGKGKRVIACGGTGLYFDVLLNDRVYTQVPINTELRVALETKSLIELQEIIAQENTQHLKIDSSTKKRSIRGIEIIRYLASSNLIETPNEKYEWELIALNPKKEIRNKNIDDRLEKRLNEGLIEEVESLIKFGVSADRLIYLGLEYKFITEYLIGKWSREEAIEKLKIAIHQFAKRQVTFFRKIEKDGHRINWINT